MILTGNFSMKMEIETELRACHHGQTQLNLVTTLKFYSTFYFLESLSKLEQRHEVRTTISVEIFRSVLQTKQKQIGR